MITFLSTHPRSGTTLNRMFMWEVFRQHSYNARFMCDPPNWLEGCNFPDIPKKKQEAVYRQWHSSKKMYYIRGHHRLNRTGNKVGRKKFHKVIIIARDGRAVAASMKHHLRDFFHRKDYTMDDIIRQKIGLYWSKYFNSWGRLIGTKHCLLLKYEDYVLRPEKVIKQMSDFTGIEPVGKWENKFDEWKKRNEFSNTFLRKGKVDSWKTELTRKQIALFEKLHHKWLKKLDYI